MFVSLGIIVVATLLVGVVTFFYRRHIAPEGGVFNGIESADGIFGVVGTGFAVLLGFVIFASFGSYQAARDYTGEEAVAVRQLATTAGYFDGREPRPAAQGAGLLRPRGHPDEWALMAQDRESADVEHWLLEIDATAQGMPVPDNRDRGGHGALARPGARRDRTPGAVASPRGGRSSPAWSGRCSGSSRSPCSASS